MAKPSRNSPSDRESKKVAPLQNLPARGTKNDNTDKVKGGATTEGVKKTMQTQV